LVQLQAEFVRNPYLSRVPQPLQVVVDGGRDRRESQVCWNYRESDRDAPPGVWLSRRASLLPLEGESGPARTTPVENRDVQTRFRRRKETPTVMSTTARAHPTPFSARRKPPKCGDAEKPHRRTCTPRLQAVEVAAR
jgi:hypothetical protein